ncbi:hypothetical protein HDU80_011125 [Chytriomyces hyalinus]|nr:hypothetical protein HDU80_011125 [Chytriomyces hyalinus]
MKLNYRIAFVVVGSLLVGVLETSAEAGIDRLAVPVPPVPASPPTLAAAKVDSPEPPLSPQSQAKNLAILNQKINNNNNPNANRDPNNHNSHGDHHGIVLPPGPLTDADRERLINEFCNENGIKREDLTPEQHDALVERFKFLEQHRGHEQQHAEMAMILFMSLIAFQIILTLWKKWHEKSFNLVSLIGLWFVPMGIGLNAGNYRFIFVWLAFSLLNGTIVRKAIFENPMKSETPRLVYRWYSYVYNASVVVGAVGYFFTFVPFFSLPSLIFGVSEQTEISMFRGGITILFYALYFGMLGRDFVDRLSDRMALMMGYYAPAGIPKKHLRANVCAICGDSTQQQQQQSNRRAVDKPGFFASLSGAGGVGGSAATNVVKMNCGHPFHEECIRGWTIIGKKDCCPSCKEKVDMKAFSRHAWDSAQLFYLNFLDALRYMLVWNPVVFLILHFVFKVFGFK